MSQLLKGDVELLSKPFPEDKLGVKVASISKNKDRALLVCYLQHTDVADRLDEVDPAWSCTITGEKQAGEIHSVRMQITIKGVVREGVGEGDAPKAAASDALKRTAMLFGVGRYLYDVDRVWAPYNEVNDKYRVFTYADYRAALRPGQVAPHHAEGQPPAQAPKEEGRGRDQKPAAPMSRGDLGKEITRLSRELRLSEKEMSDWIDDLYKKPMNRISLDEMAHFHAVLQNELEIKKGR